MALPVHAALSAAGFPRRMLAFAIDCTLIALSTVLLYAGFQLAFGAPVELFNSPAPWELFLFASASLPSWFYFALSESSARQATFGKRALKLLVVDVYGARIRFGRALLRAVVKVLPWQLLYCASGFPEPVLVNGHIAHPRLLFAVYGLLALYVAAAMMTLRKQSVHDLAAGTFVARS